MAMITELEKISPAKAKKYLELNKKNRPMRPSWVEKLAHVMKSGDWKQTHQGIAFNGDGSLKDGQHRLAAVVLSGVTVPMNVTRGMSEDAMEAIDIHCRRSDADAMKLMGFEDATTNVMALGRRMWEGMSDAYDAEFSRHELIRYVAVHLDAIKFALSCGGRRSGIGSASLRAPVARAWYTRDRDRLTEFMECINTGMMKSNADSSAIALRNVLMRDGKQFQGGRGARVALYRKTESSLVAFLERRALTKVYEVTAEQFLLPEESGK